MTRRRVLAWGLLMLAVLVPLVAAGQSPLLQWRDPIYILAGFSGIIGLGLILFQAVLISGLLPDGPSPRTHFWTGIGLMIAVCLHVIGLWITSPPDVVDVLLFRSPTPFAIWGAVAMWAVLISGLLAALRHRIGRRVWRLAHSGAAVVIVIGTLVHTWRIEGTMEDGTKAALCLVVMVTAGWALWKRKVWRMLRL